MPIISNRDSNGCYHQWGDSGKKYYYECGDESASKNAKQKAIAQAVAIGEFADQNKVSIDFDDTLSTDRGKELAKKLISEGKTVYIITRRHKLMGAPVYKVAQELGISPSRVIFTEGRLKWYTIDKLKIGTHYDNSQNEVDKINEMTDAKGMKFKIEYGNTRTGNNPDGLKSSNVWKYKYDDKKLELTIKFQDGETYTYSDVSKQLYESVVGGDASCITEGENEWGEWFVGKSPSIGAAVHEYLVNGGVSYKKGGSV